MSHFETAVLPMGSSGSISPYVRVSSPWTTAVLLRHTRADRLLPDAPVDDDGDAVVEHVLSGK